jgi:hypothetical protein
MPINSEILSKYKNDVFVETGSLIGDGIQAALDSKFNRIHSIELSTQLYITCKKRFHHNIKVDILLGDSTKLLGNIISKYRIYSSFKITYFLDAHDSGGTTVYGEKPNPLMDELEIISKFYEKGDIIIIDDLRCWKKSENCDFDLSDIKSKLMKIDPYFEFIYEDSYRKDELLFKSDLLVAK